ncbi:MAG: protein kinase [Phycisphaerales bacterium]|nr:protein kinase [Phycisphaerales bacterium]
MPEHDPNAATLPATIGPYPIERELGRGGMGVVYLARDPRLNRPVAIKVLPAAFVADPMRVQRFEREARTLAQLNHRNVGMIFGLEDAAGQRLLVLEYIPGYTLTDKLVRGPMLLDEALRVAMQVCEGLEAAHERDVVHRDLKPDNLRVTPEGLLKILDFGLATQQHQDANGPGGSHLTQAGMVMGTPGYMSPEQARGVPTDKRTDIWAFGCVLFEMLSGYKAFGGETVSDCLVAILEREPDYTLLPARTPNRLRDLLRKLLIKDPRRRMRDIGDARIELEDVLTQPQSGWYQATGASARPGTLARLIMPLSMPGVAQGASGSVATTMELTLVNSARSAVAISADGSTVAFVAGKTPQSMLYVRRMDGHDARPVPGTAGADAPFFSADGTKLGFFADGKLKRVALTGGAPVTLTAAPRHQGGSWDSDDTIYFIPDWQRGVMKIPAAGGAAALVTDPDLGSGEIALMAPDVLPGSRHALVSVWTGTGNGHDDALITAIDLRTGARKPLIHGGCNARYLASGHIIFSRGGSLLAVAFDPERLEVFGSPLAVEDKVLGNALGGSAQFAAGGDGTLVVAHGPVWEPRCQIMISAREGEPRAIISDAKPFCAPAIAPSGRLLAVQVQGATDHIWLYDLDRPANPGSRVTFLGDNACPIFTPDGTRIAFRSNMSGQYELYWMPIASAGGGGGGGGTPDLLYSSDRSPFPCGFADNGRTLVFVQQKQNAAVPGAPAAAGGLEIWSVGVDDPNSARPIAQSQASCWGASVSPDGRFLAYVCDETGRPEVYVQTMAGTPTRRQVSVEGGTAPLWAKSGGELYFRTGEQIIAVRVAVEPAFMVGRPRVMFQGVMTPATSTSANCDVTPAGEFVFLRAQEDQSKVTHLDVILNWFTELRRRVPVPQQASMNSGRMSGSGFLAGPMGGGAYPSGAGTQMYGQRRESQMPQPQHVPQPGQPVHGDASTLTRYAPTPAAPLPPARPMGPSESKTIG